VFAETEDGRADGGCGHVSGVARQWSG
jgi:hypothetical protein